MYSKYLATAAILAILALAMPAVSQQATNEINQGEITMNVNEERIVNVAITRVTVGNPSIAKATPLQDGTSVIVTALSPGRTDMRLFPLDEPNAVYVYTVNVRRTNLDELKTEIDALLAYMVGVQVEKAGENLVLKGEVLEPSDRAKLDKIIELYPEVLDFTVNRYTQVEEERLKELILTDLEDEGLTTIRVEIKNVRGEFKAMLRGVAFTDRAKERAQEIAQLYYEDVINLIQLEKPVIEVDVVVTQLDLTKSRQLGTNEVWSQLTTFQLTGYLDSNFGRSSFFDNDDDNIGQAPGAQRDDEPGLSIAPTFSLAPNGVSSFINAIKSSDAAVFYSEQHQAVLSGEKAEFNDGGTLIFRTITEDTADVTSIEFGLQVAVTPEQKEDGTIINTISVENSNPVALTGATSGSDVTLDKFKTSSVVECRSEETIVLSGADSNNTTHSDTGTPFLRRIPIANLLFRERNKQGSENRSLIFITPTSSTIFRETRASFSTAARRKVEFTRDESVYWERDIDWGYYSEFYLKPGNNVPFINTYDTFLYYDDATQSVATAGSGAYDVGDSDIYEGGATPVEEGMEDEAAAEDTELF